MRLRPTLFWLVVLGALAPALLLTLNRLVEPADGRWVRLESFTPFAILLYGATLLLLALVSLRRRRPTVLAVALVAAVGLGLHAWWFSPMLLGANPPAPDGAETLRVMTANLYVGEADGIALVRQAAEEEVDILVVEEITAGDLASMERAGLDTVFPYRAGEPGESAMGTMVFARAEVGEPTRLDTYWDAWQVDVGGLDLLAVHPHSPIDSYLWRQDHAVILDVAVRSSPDLVVGDFNATLDHPPMRALAEAGYRSVAELANEGWQPTWPAYGTVDVLGIPLPHLVQIDHVLVGRTLAAVGTHTVEIPGTDHRAVIAEVAVK